MNQNTSTVVQWDAKILGAPVSLLAVNPRPVDMITGQPGRGVTIEWDLTDGDGTDYGTVRFRHAASLHTKHRRMGDAARRYWRR